MDNKKEVSKIIEYILSDSIKEIKESKTNPKIDKEMNSRSGDCILF